MFEVMNIASSPKKRKVAAHITRQCLGRDLLPRLSSFTIFCVHEDVWEGRESGSQAIKSLNSLRRFTL